jgi:hypothetical protein
VALSLEEVSTLYSPESYWFGDMVLSAELENYRSTSQMENGNSFIYRGIQSAYIQPVKDIKMAYRQLLATNNVKCWKGTWKRYRH